MRQILENMSPDFIVVDEITTEEEAAVCREIVDRGVPVIASVHSPGLAGLVRNKFMRVCMGDIRSSTCE